MGSSLGLSNGGLSNMGSSKVGSSKVGSSKVGSSKVARVKQFDSLKAIGLLSGRSDFSQVDRTSLGPSLRPIGLFQADRTTSLSGRSDFWPIGRLLSRAESSQSDFSLGLLGLTQGRLGFGADPWASWGDPGASLRGVDPFVFFSLGRHVFVLEK